MKNKKLIETNIQKGDFEEYAQSLVDYGFSVEDIKFWFNEYDTVQEGENDFVIIQVGDLGLYSPTSWDIICSKAIEKGFSLITKGTLLRLMVSLTKIQSPDIDTSGGNNTRDGQYWYFGTNFAFIEGRHNEERHIMKMYLRPKEKIRFIKDPVSLSEYVTACPYNGKEHFPRKENLIIPATHLIFIGP